MKYLAIFFISISLPSTGAVIHPFKKDKMVHVKYSDIEFPENFEKSLKSGFSNVILVQLYIWKNGKLFQNKNVSNRVVFDLWDEVYFLTRVGDSNVEEKLNIKTGILEKLRSYTLTNIFSINDIGSEDTLEMNLRIVTDPISKEKRKKIRSWLAENQVNLPSAGGASAIKTHENKPSRAQASAFETIKTSVFTQVLDAELNADIVDGAWVFESEKLKFNAKDIKDEK